MINILETFMYSEKLHVDKAVTFGGVTVWIINWFKKIESDGVKEYDMHLIQRQEGSSFEETMKIIKAQK